VTQEAERSQANIEKTDAALKYINFRAAREDFIDVKTCALKEGLTLGEYLLHAHRVYQQQKKG